MKVTIELNITDYLLARDRFYEATEKAKLEIDKNKFIPVSYTHLTLPTSDLV